MKERKKTLIQKQIDPTSDEFYTADERVGNGVNPLHGLEALIRAYFKSYTNVQEFPMYKYLARFSQLSEVELENQNSFEYPAEESSGMMGDSTQRVYPKLELPDPGPDLGNPQLAEVFVDWKSDAYLTRDYSKLTDDEKLKMSADEILSLYLFEISKKVSPEFYLILLKFVVGFRECLNKYGWEKKAENDESILQKYQEKQQTEPPVVIPPPDDVIKKANELQ